MGRPSLQDLRLPDNVMYDVHVVDDCVSCIKATDNEGNDIIAQVEDGEWREYQKPSATEASSTPPCSGCSSVVILPFVLVAGWDWLF